MPSSSPGDAKLLRKREKAANAASVDAIWTGGQWSLLRVLFGVYLFAVAARGFLNVPETGTEFSFGLLEGDAANGWIFLRSMKAIALALIVAFTVGWKTRVVAVLLFLGEVMTGSTVVSGGLGLFMLPWAFVPGDPYGSLDARGRPDPGGDWSCSPWIRLWFWVWLAIAVTGTGVGHLTDSNWMDGTELAAAFGEEACTTTRTASVIIAGLQASFLFLVLLRTVRPWAWLASFLGHLALGVVSGVGSLPLALALVHLPVFDRRWIPPRVAPEPEPVFYDGDCGLCHRLVRLLLAEDAALAFRVGPLGTPTFEREIPAEVRGTLPDSIVLRRSDGAVLVRSDAAIHILRGLGGLWGLVGIALTPVPRFLRDLGYDAIARVRRSIFAKPEGACPLVPPHLAGHFLPLD